MADDPGPVAKGVGIILVAGVLVAVVIPALLALGMWLWGLVLP